MDVINARSVAELIIGLTSLTGELVYLCRYPSRRRGTPVLSSPCNHCCRRDGFACGG